MPPPRGGCGRARTFPVRRPSRTGRAPPRLPARRGRIPRVRGPLRFERGAPRRCRSASTGCSRAPPRRSCRPARAGAGQEQDRAEPDAEPRVRGRVTAGRQRHPGGQGVTAIIPPGPSPRRLACERAFQEARRLGVRLVGLDGAVRRRRGSPRRRPSGAASSAREWAAFRCTSYQICSTWTRLLLSGTSEKMARTVPGTHDRQFYPVVR